MRLQERGGRQQSAACQGRNHLKNFKLVSKQGAHCNKDRIKREKTTTLEISTRTKKGEKKILF